MRIAFITPSLQLGGYEKVVIAYANELNRRGHQVDILCGFKIGELINTVNDGVSIIDFQSRARSFIIPLIRYLKTNKVDILYCGFRSYNCIGVIAKKISGVNTCIYASQHGFQRDYKIERFIRGRIINQADQLVAVTKTVAEFEAKQMNIDIDKFTVLNNPVYDNETEIKYEKHPWFDEDIPIIAVCGRLAPDKGKKYGIRILKELNNLMNVRMLVLGDGPEKNECEKLAKDLKIDDKIDFIGFVQNPKGYMIQCKMLLHTAEEEAFGNIIVDALSVGIPICATSCTGPMYIIEDGKYGVSLGKVTDENFVFNSTKKIFEILNGKIKFDNLQKRAADFEIKKATDMFLKVLTNK